MTLKFFERRKLLKGVNTLDLTPVRLMEFELKDDGTVDILLPRFKNQALKRAFHQKRKGEHIQIHLDAIGSAIWLQIDGKMNVNDLCAQLQTMHPEKLTPPDETEGRVSKFLSLLYQERYITFMELSE